MLKADTSYQRGNRELGWEHFLSGLFDDELDCHQQPAAAHIAYDWNALRKIPQTVIQLVPARRDIGREIGFAYLLKNRDSDRAGNRVRIRSVRIIKAAIIGDGVR